jgi:hypothetical protein
MLGQLNDSELRLQADISPFAVKPKFNAKLKLKALSLSPFAQLLRPHLNALEGRLNLDIDIQAIQATAAGYRLTQKGKFGLEQVLVKSIDLEISEKQLTWEGTISIQKPEFGEQQQLTAEGQIQGTRLDMALPSNDLHLGHNGLSWKGKFNFTRNNSKTDIHTNSEINVSDLQLETAEWNIAEKSLTWKGILQLAVPLKSEGFRLSTTGQLKSDQLVMNMPARNLVLKYGNQFWEGKIEARHQPAQLQIELDRILTLDDTLIETPEFTIAEKQTVWEGDTLHFNREGGIQLSDSSNNHRLYLPTDGKLDGRKMNGTFHQENLKLVYPGFVWDAGPTYEVESVNTTTTVDGNFRINDLQMNHTKQNLSLLKLKQLSLDGIKMESLHQVNVSNAEIKGLNLLKPSETQNTPDERTPLFSFSKANFENVVFAPNKYLGMDSATLENAAIYLQHSKEGKWTYISDLKNILAGNGTGESEPRDQPKHSAKPGAGNKTETKKFGFRIDRLQIVGDSSVRFEDEAVNPHYFTNLNFTQALVSDLDNRRPEQPSPVKLAASVGKSARLNLQGHIQPFTERFSMDVTGNIEAIELPPLSPYTVKKLGYNFVSGEMDADVSLKIILGKLQGKSNFQFKNLNIKAAEKKQEAKQEAGLKIPLESTLKLLRDKKNNIHLNVPISGDITDPKFSFTDALNQAVFKALQMASLSYLKYMLGPYGTAIGIAELAIKVIPGIRLKPVFFAPGSIDLDEDAVAYLQKIATILRDRLDLQMSVCGLATEKDRIFFNEQGLKEGSASSSIDDKLLDLAKKRAELIEDHLVSQRGIEEKRIFICKPEFDKNAEASPRVELLI